MHSAPSRPAGGRGAAVGERALAHARVLRARGNALPPEGLPGQDILDSWLRCLDRGQDFARAPRIELVDGAEVARRRERADFVRRLAQAELETLAQQIAGSNHLLAFADRDGVILDLYTDNRFRMSGAAAGIAVGGCWSEALAGTNGLGTALAEQRPVAVTGLEHYHLSLGDVSCAAAPICDALGEVVGVLDASSYFESRQRHTHALVQMAATHIENQLLLHQMRGHLVLAIHPRAEFLGTLSVGLLAFDGDGLLAALNPRARQMLVGLDASAGTPFEALFGEPFDRVLGRLLPADELRLRDALGSTIVARCVVRPAATAAAFARAAARPTAATPAAASPPVALRDGGGAARWPTGPTAKPRTVPHAGLPTLPDFVADDTQVQQACRQAEAALRLNAPILLVGETGSGKELLARHLHHASGRRGAFVAVNCGALPADLFEAELFGYVGGAFTGARREGSAGLALAADGGTLLLDEVRELPLPQQAALLRFLDDRVVRPVGGVQQRRVELQIVAATNVEPRHDVAAGRLRADLMYRLDTVRVDLPPLRQRSDFARAVAAVLAEIDAEARIDDDAVQALARHAWPGNFRELRAVLTRAIVAGGALRLGRADVEPLLPAAPAGDAAAASALQRHATVLIQREVERCGGSVSEAARQLGVSRTTIYRHLRSAAAARRCARRRAVPAPPPVAPPVAPGGRRAARYPRTMYAEHFRLRNEPFSIAPDPRFLFMSAQHREALAHLLYGVGGGGGFVLLTGEIGAGKTTVCRCFLEQVPPHCRVAYIFNPKLSVPELLQTICEEFRIALPAGPAGTGVGTGVKVHVDALNRFLLAAHARGENAVLIIDEAQSLSAEVLEQLRLLTNLETAERKLLQIVLIGQPELRTMLEQTGLEQLAQRVIARYHLGALGADETTQYVKHRVVVAGGTKLPFEREAMARLHALSGGVPRRINLLADRALLGAYSQGRRKVDRETLERAAREVFGKRGRLGFGWPDAPAWGWALAAGIVALVGVAAFGAWRLGPGADDGAAAAASAVMAVRSPGAASAAAGLASTATSTAISTAISTAAPTAAPTAAKGPAALAAAASAPRAAASSATNATGAALAGAGGLDKPTAASAGGLAPLLAAAPRRGDEALRALAALWQVPPTDGEPCAAVATSGLACHRGRDGFAALQPLDRPAVLMLRGPQGETVPVLLVGLDARDATLLVDGVRHRVRRAELAAAWRGEFNTLWRPPPGWRAGGETTPEPVRAWARERLAAAGLGDERIALRERVWAFQVASGLEPDGVPGPLTLMLLARQGGDDREPRLMAAASAASAVTGR